MGLKIALFTTTTGTVVCNPELHVANTSDQGVLLSAPILQQLQARDVLCLDFKVCGVNHAFLARQ